MTPCAIARVMQEAERAWRASLDGVTVADLASRVGDDAAADVVQILRPWLSGGSDRPA